MRISPRVALLGVLAALSGWLVRGIRFDVEASPLPAPIAKTSTTVVESAPQFAVQEPLLGSYSGRSTRNLFAYTEREVPVVQRAVFTPPPVITEPPPVPVTPQIQERPRIRFTHRYIGRFGPDHRPIAAFARDGEVVTVRIGERIDERFVLRAIGVESVDVETTVDGEVQSERIPLTGS